jgi:hypothetical protein
MLQNQNTILTIFDKYTQFIKSTRLNKPMQLSSLPPTNAAAQSCDQEWGWILQNDILEPTTTLLPPAPEELLYRISLQERL